MISFLKNLLEELFAKPLARFTASLSRGSVKDKAGNDDQHDGRKKKERAPQLFAPIWIKRR
jgi:hypothetical protein